MRLPGVSSFPPPLLLRCLRNLPAILALFVTTVRFTRILWNWERHVAGSVTAAAAAPPEPGMSFSCSIIVLKPCSFRKTPNCGEEDEAEEGTIVRSGRPPPAREKEARLIHVRSEGSVRCPH